MQLKVLIRASLAAATLSTAARAQVVIVDGASAGTYPDIQSAIDAAADGDVLLVGPGIYAAFTIDVKGVSVFAMPGSSTYVAVPVVVRNLPSSSRVVLHGLQSSGVGPSASPGLKLENDVGHIRVQDCSWTARSAFGSGPIAGGDGANVANCAHVVLAHCTLRGGAGKPAGTFPFPNGGNGGSGVNATNSTVALLDSLCSGARGGDAGFGGTGGDGVRASNAMLFASGSELSGGAGGAAPTTAWCSGAGGNGLWLQSGEARVLDNLYLRGAGGLGGGQGCAGGPGVAKLSSGTLVELAGSAREVDGPAIVGDATPFPLTVAGEDSDVARLRIGRRPSWTYAATPIGPQLVPTSSATVLLGVIPSSGALVAQVHSAPVGAPRLARVDYLQLVVDDASALRFLGEARHTLVFDDAAGPDCNGNAVPDAFDIATGASADNDFNGVPDECP